VPERWVGEAEPAFVDDFAAPKRAEHAAIEQVVLGPDAGFDDGLGEGRGFADVPLVLEQPFDDADGGMERRAAAFRMLGAFLLRFAVPAAVCELLAEKLRPVRGSAV
jgi:hypothetical protein